MKKQMAKDPAFLFYPGDWMGGTITFSRIHKGAYMDLLMAQYNNGHLSLEDIKIVLGDDFEKMWEQKLKSKFVKDDNGLYYNKKLEEVILKRKAFSESRRKNLESKKAHKKTHKGKHMDKHMENEDENEDVKENEDKSLHSALKKIFLNYYLDNKQIEYYWSAKDAGSLKNLITKLKFYCEKDEQVPDVFNAILVKNKDKWINDNLSVSIINSKFNEIVSKIKSSTDSRIEQIKRKFNDNS